MDNFQQNFFFFFGDIVHVQVLFWLMKTNFSNSVMLKQAFLNAMKAEALALQDILTCVTKL